MAVRLAPGRVRERLCSDALFVFGDFSHASTATQ